MKKSRVIIAIILLICVLATVTFVAMAADGETGHGGLSIRGEVEKNVYHGKDSPYAMDSYRMDKNLSVIPVTVEAWVYIPESAASSDLGTLYGNFWSKNNYGTASLNYEILAGGVPRIYWSDSIESIYDIKFEASALPVNEWAHLTLVYDGESGIVACYVNGKLTEEKYSYPEMDPDVLTLPMNVGGDNRAMNPNYFKGEIGDITVYADVRSATEIAADCARGMDADKADFSDAICYYNIGADSIGKNITDGTGNGNDMIYAKTWLTEEEMVEIRKSYGFTPAYSFAVIGDTQTTTDYYPEKLPTLYKWIADNADDRNIVFSIGLGDITNDNGRDDKYSKGNDGLYYVDASGQYIQWDVAYDAITLLDGKVPYSLIRGNHDVYADYNDSSKRLEGFNTRFENSAFFTSQFTAANGGGRYGDGQYDNVNDVTDLLTKYPNSYANTFQTITVGKNSYLFVNLDWKMTDSIIEWANNVIAAHPDHRVVISTHAYLNGDATTHDSGDPTPNGSYNGEELWQSLVSRHENVEFVLSGHISNDRIIYNQVKGKNGNTVTEMLIDPQGYDAQLGGCSMVAMFLFDESGEKLAVEWYSTVKDRYFKTTDAYVIDLSDDNENVDERIDPVWDGVTAIAPRGAGTESDPYLVSSGANLLWMSNNIKVGAVSFAGKYFLQTADIDLCGNALPSIGTYYFASSDMAAFGGHYDGGGYSIKNGSITMKDSSRSFATTEGYGLFGVIWGATIENVVLDDIQVIGRGTTGAIVGRAVAPTVSDTAFLGFNSIVNCEVKSAVKIATILPNGAQNLSSGNDSELRAGRVGSVCGMAYGTVIKGCVSEASFAVSADFDIAGGIVGTAGLNTSVEFCKFSGKIMLRESSAAKNSYIGGIVGAVSPTLDTLNLDGSKLGISGTFSVKDCYNAGSFAYTGSVSTSDVYYGGIVGFAGALADVEGGAETYPYVIENSYNLFAYEREDANINAAGIVALASAGEKTLYVKNCYSVDLDENVSLGTNEYGYTAGTTTVDGLAAIAVTGNCATLNADAMSEYTAAVDNGIALIAATDHQPLWLIGSGAPTAAAPEGTLYFNYSANVYYVYESGAWASVKNITITESTLYTPYGAIDPKYANNVFVVFSYTDGKYNCVYGSDTLTDVLNTDKVSARTYCAKPGSLAVVYMRGNYVSDQSISANYGYICGTMIIDLGGNTITQAASNDSLFKAYAKYNSSTGYGDATYKLMNGNVVLKSHSLFKVGMEGGTAYAVETYDKTLFWTLDNVKLSIADNPASTLKSVFTEFADNSGPKALRNMYFDLTINDNCEIDLTNAPSGITLFNAHDSYFGTDLVTDKTYYATNSIVSISVGACEIKAQNSSFVWQKVADNNSSVVYEKSADGAFFGVTVPSGVDFGNDTFADKSGKQYVLVEESNDTALGTVTYTLGTDNTEPDTPYGDIPSDYANNLLVLFKKNADGSYDAKKGYDSFATALADAGNNFAYKDNDATWVIYLTADTTNTAGGTGNLGFNTGKVIIDLGGHTLTQGGGVPLIRAITKFKTGYYEDGYFELINGNIVLNDKGIFNVGTEGSGYNNEPDKFKTIFWTVDNVNISLAEGATVSSIFVSDFRDADLKNGNKKMTFDLTVKDTCTVDITNATNKVTLFNANDPIITGMSSSTNYYANSIVNVTVLGCKIIANDTSFVWSDVHETNGSSVVFTNGAAVSVKLPTGTYTYDDIYTPYGNVASGMIGNTFVVFEYKNGVYTNVYANSDMAQALAGSSGARKYCADEGTTAVVYMMCDTTSVAISGNLCYINGTMIIDLGGHTLTQGADEPIFRTYAKCSAHSSSNTGEGVEHQATFIFKNGNVKLNTHGIFGVGMEGGSAYAVSKCVKAVDWTLDGINVSLADGATVTNVFAVYTEKSGATAGARDMYFNLTLKESCTVDISNATNKVTIFNANDTVTSGKYSGSNYATNSISTITVEGCKIIAKESEFVLTDVNESNGSSVTFVKGDNGKYVTLTLANGAGAPASIGKLSFVKISESTDGVTYELTDVNVNSYVPKMNITLHSELIMNVYIPVNGTQRFTFDGIAYEDMDALAENIVTIDGVEYYLMATPLPSNVAARSLLLDVSVKLGETSASAKFTFSIPKYAAKVIASDTASDSEKTLIYDVLAYIKSAAAYFGGADTSDIDSILGDYSAEFIKTEGVTSVTEGLHGVTFVLDASPAIRFYLSEGANPEAYEFKQGITSLEGKMGTQIIGGVTYTYIDISLNAYRMIKTVDYYVNGVMYGSFHVNSYYDYVSGDGEDSYAGEDKAALKDLVEKFYTYCASASNYKAEIDAK